MTIKKQSACNSGALEIICNSDSIFHLKTDSDNPQAG